MAKFIDRENLELLINHLKASCDEFIAPKREHLSDIIFGDTKNEGGELLDYEGNSVVSPRAFLLPQTEPLFEIKSAKNCQFKPIEDKKKRIFYGVRPCDIKALGLMRKFFIGAKPEGYGAASNSRSHKESIGRTEKIAEKVIAAPPAAWQEGDFLDDGFVDAPYKQKMDNSVFISLACGKRCMADSFCHLMDAGPIAKDGFDLQLIPVSRGYLVEAGSKKGRGIVNKHKKFFSKALPRDKKEAGLKLKGFGEKIKKMDYKKLAKIMKEDTVAQEVWEDIGRRCVVCSGCISLCPTCSCFSVSDRLDGDKGMRFRYCDGCVYAGFTRMAGGNTPFPQHKDHIRRFFEHKLNIDVERYGTSSCVGCGRCIETCPGNISIKKFIDAVR